MKRYKPLFENYETEEEENLPISYELATKIGKRIGMDFNKIDLWEFWQGINIELGEHGKAHPDTNIFDGDDNLIIIGKIAMSHLKYESPQYYTDLIAMEKERGYREEE